MSNILNHNRDAISLDLVKENYWDFSLALRDSFNTAGATPISKCLAVHIDTNIPECRNDLSERLISKTVWDDADAEDVIPLTNIGLTGLDSGLLYFDPTTMSNKEFMQIYTDSTLVITEADRFYLTKAKSIYPELRMDADIVVDGEEEIAMLNGGFYQGFFHLPDHNYKVLPTEIDKGWKMDFRLKPTDFNGNGDTLNSLHPENKGIFFYIGTRSENKWYYLYKTDLPDPVQRIKYPLDYAEGYFATDDGLNAQYIAEEPEAQPIETDGDFIANTYTPETDDPTPFIAEGYLQKDIEIDPSFIPPTDDGFAAGQPNIREFETDNKFITYNRTKDGRKVGDGKDDTVYIMTEIVRKGEENYFTLFNRSAKGRFDINNIDEYRKEHSRHYDVYADLHRNALGFQITDDGRIGYRYIVRDCDGNDEYKVESEYSSSGRVKKDEWNDVSVSIRPILKDKMKIFIRIGKRLVLVSRDLPILKLRKLDDIYTRQESVPFHISLGGGTTGLATAVYPDFRTRPNTVLPLEAVFGGTFIGYIKEFRFFTCISD